MDRSSIRRSDGLDAYKILRGEWMVGQQIQRIEMLDKFGANLAGNVRDGLKLTVRDTAKQPKMCAKRSGNAFAICSGNTIS